jgi:hypothetical protein
LPRLKKLPIEYATVRRSCRSGYNSPLKKGGALRELTNFRGLLVSAIEKARGEQQRDGSDVSAGRYEGLCQALKLLDEELEKATRTARNQPKGTGA